MNKIRNFSGTESVVTANRKKTLFEEVCRDIRHLNNDPRMSIEEIACMVHDDRCIGSVCMNEAESWQEFDRATNVWFGATAILWSYRWRWYS